MSIIKLPQDAFDFFTVNARPERTFLSSSNGKIGGLKVFKRVSKIEKDSSVFNDSAFSDNTVESILDSAIKETKKSIPNFDVSSLLKKYIDGVNNLDVDFRGEKTVDVIRFTQSYSFTSDTLRKNIIRKVLLPYYRQGYPEIGWGYTNYLDLHFPNNVGSISSSIIYPNPKIDGNPVYSPKKDFTIEFYIKPSYSHIEYSPGTIMHMSSCFAVSIVSGSSKDYEGNVDTFRILLQLSKSADVQPNSINLSSIGTGLLDLAYLSEDGFIKKNYWHHVAMTWAPTHNNSTGSFYIDGKVAGSFPVPYNAIPFSASSDGRSSLFIGNFYEGQNTYIRGPHGFFSLDAVNDEGVTNSFNATSLEPLYPNHLFRNPFKGELHELRIWNSRRSSDKIISGSIDGVELSEDLLFYVPPFFRKETSDRKILQTPFQSHVSTTDDPINVALSFGVDGHYVNLENHTREFVRGYYPRLLHLTSSEIPTSYGSYSTTNEYLYASGSTRRRNLTILPCDNGKFKPNFSLLISGTSYNKGEAMEKFVDNEGSPDLSCVNMSSLVDDSTLYSKLDFGTDIFYKLLGATPEDPGVEQGSVLTILQRTGDNSSNSVTIFDASNLFYGGRIYEGSYELIDPAFTGSDGTLRLKLKDNKRGSLYRADANSEHATWATCGFVLYPEGISVVTTPYYGNLFGKDDFQVNLLGNQNVHVLEIQAIAPAWQLNRSRNKRWQEIRVTDYSNDKEPGFVSINRINFHDENLNIVARAELARPINKRYSDRIMFRTKFDF